MYVRTSHEDESVSSPLFSFSSLSSYESSLLTLRTDVSLPGPSLSLTTSSKGTLTFQTTWLPSSGKVEQLCCVDDLCLLCEFSLLTSIGVCPDKCFHVCPGYL